MISSLGPGLENKASRRTLAWARGTLQVEAWMSARQVAQVPHRDNQLLPRALRTGKLGRYTWGQLSGTEFAQNRLGEGGSSSAVAGSQFARLSPQRSRMNGPLRWLLLPLGLPKARSRKAGLLKACSPRCSPPIAVFAHLLSQIFRVCRFARRAWSKLIR